MSARWLIGLLLLLLVGFTPLSCESEKVRVGSKKFTESVILGELAAHLARNEGFACAHEQELGGTRIVFEALKSGDVDLYPDYTGTISHEILAAEDGSARENWRETLRAQGIRATEPLGFDNSYGLAMKAEVAGRLGIETISDLARHPDLVFRFSNEFMDRADGWPKLQKTYGLTHADVQGMDHDLAYRQLDQGACQVIDVYTTDTKIRYYNLKVLEDDRDCFPTYEALYLYRADLEPRVIEALRRLEGTISRSEMMTMNGRTELHRVPESRVAADFLQRKFSIAVTVHEETVAGRVWKHTREHLDLVRTSLVAAILVAVPLGIWAAKQPAAGQVILGAVGIIQTIPALALLVLLMRPAGWLALGGVGSGSATAVIALFLYSLLPIVRNTCSGLQDIPLQIRESAAAVGLPPGARLRLIELPLAARTILAGIKTASVINVGFATLGALIGAGGYGQPILTGIRLNSHSLILQGAVPAAVLALVVQGGFELAERFCVPKGLRLKAER